MKFIDEIKKDSYAKQYEKLQKEKQQFDKTLYDSDIIQGLFNRVNELEDRIKNLEDKENLK